MLEPIQGIIQLQHFDDMLHRFEQNRRGGFSRGRSRRFRRPLSQVSSHLGHMLIGLGRRMVTN